MDSTQIVLPPEAEAIVQAIGPMDLELIGSLKWQQQHEHIEKLNMQAVLNASQQEEEFIKEFIVTYEKIPVLIHELIVTEIWKQNVFPEILELDLDHGVMFPMYMVLYHEATVANLLETVLYHRDAVESAEDTSLDLLDYCYRKLSLLAARQEEEEAEDEDEQPDTDISTVEELEKQERKLNFDICVKSVSILRYIIDHLTSVPLSVTARALNTHDVPMLLVQLICSPPWCRHGNTMKYVDNKWQKVEEPYKLTKIEAQAWLALYQLLLSEHCQHKYELTQSRKNTLLKLRNQLIPVLLDQLPVLADLQRYIEELSVLEPPAAKQQLLLEQVPEIRDTILMKNDKRWVKIAKKQSNTVFNPKNTDLKAQAQRLAATYDLSALDQMLEPPKCALCGAEAAKRCSRCQNEWYCRRECQVNHWKKHKKACDLLVDSITKIAQQQVS